MSSEMASSQLFWAHRYKLDPKQYLNAPHVGVRLFYSKQDALSYFNNPDFIVVPVRLVPDLEGEVEP